MSKIFSQGDGDSLSLAIANTLSSIEINAAGIMSDQHNVALLVLALLFFYCWVMTFLQSWKLTETLGISIWQVSCAYWGQPSQSSCVLSFWVNTNARMNCLCTAHTFDHDWIYSLSTVLYMMSADNNINITQALQLDPSHHCTQL